MVSVFTFWLESLHSDLFADVCPFLPSSSIDLIPLRSLFSFNLRLFTGGKPFPIEVFSQSIGSGALSNLTLQVIKVRRISKFESSFLQERSKPSSGRVRSPAFPNKYLKAGRTSSSFIDSTALSQLSAFRFRYARCLF